GVSRDGVSLGLPAAIERLVTIGGVAFFVLAQLPDSVSERGVVAAVPGVLVVEIFEQRGVRLVVEYLATGFGVCCALCGDEQYHGGAWEPFDEWCLPAEEGSECGGGVFGPGVGEEHSW